jgi:hypothetical protein
MNRGRFLFFYGIDTMLWVERYGMEPFHSKCSSCGAPTFTSIPFVTGEYRGLIAPKCGCGNEKTPYCFVRDPRFGDLIHVPVSARTSSRTGVLKTAYEVHGPLKLVDSSHG